MKVIQNEKLEGSKIALTIAVSQEELDKAQAEAFRKNAAKVRVPGFRPGKAPRKMIEKLYGENVFMEEAINIAFPPAYEDAIKETGLNPIDQADVEMVNLEDGFTFKATFTVMPEVKIDNYKGLEGEKAEVTVSEDDVKFELESMQRRNGRDVAVDRAVKDGDTAVIDFEGFLNGVAFDGGKGEKHPLKIGSGQFIPGFEEQVIGMKVDEERDITVTFPESYQAEELAGKEVIFKIKLHEVKETELPAIDDEFAKDVSEFETLGELKESIKQKIEDSRNAQVNEVFQNIIFDKMIENLTAEVPEVLVERQLEQISQNFAQRLASQGLTLEAYLQMSGMDMDAFQKNFRPQAERQVKITLSLDEIARLEKIEITDADIDAEYTKLSEQYGMELDKVKMYLPAEMMKEDLVRMRATDVVISSAKAIPLAEKAPAKKPAAKKTAEKKETEEKKPAAKKAAGEKKTTTTKKTTSKKAE